jgi:hypothetical protein
MEAEVSTHTFLTMIIEESADNSVFPYSNANNMRVTQDLNSFGEMRTVQLMKKMSDASKNPKEFKSWVTRILFALLYGKTELSAVKYFAICS